MTNDFHVIHPIERNCAASQISQMFLPNRHHCVHHPWWHQFWGDIKIFAMQDDFFRTGCIIRHSLELDADTRNYMWSFFLHILYHCCSEKCRKENTRENHGSENDKILDFQFFNRTADMTHNPCHLWQTETMDAATNLSIATHDDDQNVVSNQYMFE